MKNISLSFLLFVLVFFSANAQPGFGAKNLNLAGHLSYPVNLNDVWAYVDSAGNEYALVGTIAGLSIVDLEDPTQPEEIHFIPGDTSIWRDMHIYENYAYVSNETGGGTLIVDLSQLPANITWKDTVMNNLFTAHNVWVEDHYLYIIGFNFFGGLAIYDLEPDPWNPTPVGAYFARYVHDAYIRGNYAYTAEVLDGFLTILDITNKSNPQVIANHTYPNAFTHNTWLNDSGNVCFTTDELAQAYLYAWDVSDPSDIKELDKIQTSLSYGKSVPHNTHVKDDYLITSWYADGVHITDAARPGNLVEVGYFDTSPRTGAGLRGCWGAYPFLPSGYILATDMEQGFFVLEPDYQRACYLEGDIKEAGTGMVLSGVEIEIIGTEVKDFSRNAGDYAVGIAESGTYKVIYSKYGYNRETRTVTLDNGVLVVENIDMTPSSQVEFSVSVLEEGTNQPIGDVWLEITSTDSSHTVMTDNTGGYSETDFLTGGYKLIAGKWGYQSVGTNLDITASNNQVTVYLKKGYYDDFTFDFNWVGTASAIKGNWTRGIPMGTYSNGFMFNPDHDSRTDLGGKAFITGNGGGEAKTDDVEGGPTMLFSPQFDLSTYNDPMISFDWWMANRNLMGAKGNDTMIVELIIGGVAYEVGRMEGYRAFWELAEIRPLDYAPLNQVNFLRISIADQSPDQILEAGIDHFRIIELNNTAAETPELEISLKVWPVPNQGDFQVEWDHKGKVMPDKLEMIDLYGKTLIVRDLQRGQNSLKIATPLPSGMYILQLKRNGLSVGSTKMTIMR